MAYSNNILEDLKYQYRYGGIVTQLIMINVAVFTLQMVTQLVFFLADSGMGYTALIRWFELPADPLQLIKQPWSLLTYMFMHNGFWHILFNMLWFYWFARIFSGFLGEKRILSLYVLGGLSGAVLYLLAYNLAPALDPSSAYMLGASAGVTAVVLATAAHFPNYEIRLFILGAIPIKYIAFVFILMDIAQIPFSNAGGHIAHIGGAIYGLAYSINLQNGRDLARPFDRLVDNLLLGWSRLTAVFSARPRSRMRVVHQRKTVPEDKQARKRNAPAQPTDQERVDEILDKISRSGYDSLSKDEKDFLFKYSNKG